MECEGEDWNQRGGSKKEKVLLRDPLLVGQVSKKERKKLLVGQVSSYPPEASKCKMAIFQTPKLWSEVPPDPGPHSHSGILHLCNIHCILQKMR